MSRGRSARSRHRETPAWEVQRARGREWDKAEMAGTAQPRRAPWPYGFHPTGAGMSQKGWDSGSSEGVCDLTRSACSRRSGCHVLNGQEGETGAGEQEGGPSRWDYESLGTRERMKRSG